MCACNYDTSHSRLKEVSKKYLKQSHDLVQFKMLKTIDRTFERVGTREGSNLLKLLVAQRTSWICQ